MATNEIATPPTKQEDDDTRPIEMPAGWLERALAQARRLGRPAVPEPVTPAPQLPKADGEIAWRYVNGRRVHPSWPPGYIEWLDEMRESGELEIGDPDELRRAFNDPRPE